MMHKKNQPEIFSQLLNAGGVVVAFFGIMVSAIWRWIAQQLTSLGEEGVNFCRDLWKGGKWVVKHIGIHVLNLVVSSANGIGCFFIGFGFAFVFVIAFHAPFGVALGIAILVGVCSAIPNFTLSFAYCKDFFLTLTTDPLSLFRYDYEKVEVNDATVDIDKNSPTFLGYVKNNGKKYTRYRLSDDTLYIKNEAGHYQQITATDSNSILLDRSDPVHLDITKPGVIKLDKVTIDNESCQRYLYGGKIYVAITIPLEPFQLVGTITLQGVAYNKYKYIKDPDTIYFIDSKNNKVKVLTDQGYVDAELPCHQDFIYRTLHYEQANGQDFSWIKKTSLVGLGVVTSIAYSVLFAMISLHALHASLTLIGPMAILFPPPVIILILVSFGIGMAVMQYAEFVNLYRQTPSMWYSFKKLLNAYFRNATAEDTDYGHVTTYRTTPASVTRGLIKFLFMAIGVVAVIAISVAGIHATAMALHVAIGVAIFLGVLNAISLMPFTMMTFEYTLKQLPIIARHYKNIYNQPNTCEHATGMWWGYKIFAFTLLTLACFFMVFIIVFNAAGNALVGGNGAYKNAGFRHLIGVHALLRNTTDILFGVFTFLVSFCSMIRAFYDTLAIHLAHGAESTVGYQPSEAPEKKASKPATGALEKVIIPFLREISPAEFKEDPNATQKSKEIFARPVGTTEGRAPIPPDCSWFTFTRARCYFFSTGSELCSSEGQGLSALVGNSSAAH